MQRDLCRLVGPLFDWGEEQLGLKGKADPVEAVEALAPRAVPGKVRGLEGRDVAVNCRGGGDGSRGAVDRGGHGRLGGRPDRPWRTGDRQEPVLGELRDRFAGLAPGGLRSLWLEGRCLSWGESLAYWPFR